MREPRKERNLKLVNGRWYCDFTFGGKRYREFGGWTKDQARNTLVKLRAERLDVARGFKKAAIEDILFEDFGAEVIEVYSKPNKRSWKRDEISLKVLKRFFKGHALAGIGPASIEEFKAKRRIEGSDSSTNRELAFLKTIFNLAVAWGRLESSPAAKVKKFREPSSRERILSTEEILRLLGAAGRELRPVIITALGTGMRRGEILALKWADLDFVRGLISIRTSKSGKPRKVPMSGSVAAALGAVPRRGEHVFQNVETGRPIRDVKTAFRAACRRAKKNPDDEKDLGIVGLRFHDLRHTAASKMIESGVDLVTVSKVLGHSSIQMTMRYAHPTPENIRLAIERLGDAFNQAVPNKVEITSGSGLEHGPITPSKTSH